MRTYNGLSPFCVYAIKKSRKLHEISKNGGTGQLTERKRWTSAKKLLAEVQRNGRRMPIIFAAAENTENLIYYAEITKITLHHDATTTYSFTRLTPIDGRVPKTQLRKSTGKRIHSNFIKSYAICHTPAFLKQLVENGPPVTIPRPANIDRISLEAAASVLNKLLPNQHLQRLILKELAKSIGALPAGQEGIQWALTLRANYVRLNIGRIEAFKIDRDKVRVLISDSEVDQGLREKIRRFEQREYRAIPGAFSVNMSHRQFSTFQEDLRGPHTTFINQALAEGRRTSYARSHSPGLIQFINEQFPLTPSKLNELPDLSSREREDAEIQSRTDIGRTEKEQLIQARRGQGIFRANVSHFETACRVTGISIPEHLIASHIKPWRESTDEERISGHNGLLLAPHIDHLFDGGWLSFEDNGSLLISQSLNENVLAAWGISDQLTLRPFSQKQTEFLKYHRKYVFKR